MPYVLAGYWAPPGYAVDDEQTTQPPHTDGAGPLPRRTRRRAEIFSFVGFGGVQVGGVAESEALIPPEQEFAFVGRAGITAGRGSARMTQDYLVRGGGGLRQTRCAAVVSMRRKTVVYHTRTIKPR